MYWQPPVQGTAASLAKVFKGQQFTPQISDAFLTGTGKRLAILAAEQRGEQSRNGRSLHSEFQIPTLMLKTKYTSRCSSEFASIPPILQSSFRDAFPPLLLNQSRSRSSRHLDGLLNAIRLGRVDLLARFGDLGEDGLVGQLGDDSSRLVLEGDFVALDACTHTQAWVSKASKPVESACWGG